MCFQLLVIEVFPFEKKVSVLEAQQHVPLCLLSADGRALLKYTDTFENAQVTTKFLQFLPVF